MFIVLLLGVAAAAQDLAIQSFDGDGAISFNGIAGAGEYHMERWLDPGWAHLFTVPAPGGGVVTGSVSQVDPCMLVRVRAGQPDDYLVIDLAGGVDATNYPVSTLAGVPAGGWTEEHRTTKLVLRRTPAGTFTMGSPARELGRYSDETEHQVTLTQEFYIGVFEVTQEQWYRVMGNWPSYFDNVSYRESRPVERVFYYAIRGSYAGSMWPGHSLVDEGSFLGRLREKTGLRELDLPTEAQWEYACRAGTTTGLNSGKDVTDIVECPNMREVGRHLDFWLMWMWPPSFHEIGLGSSGTTRVGSYLANGWGLYDMHGNVIEWCLDWYGEYPGTVVDPVGPPSGSQRVDRGGCWNHYAPICRSAYRGNGSQQPGGIGFRLARTLP
jgi:formylglycine-generating enzyme required for sulfatase activity